MKVFSHLVTSEIKPIIVKNMPSVQIGAVPGHRAQEYLFTPKSFLAMKEKEKVAIGLTLLDLINQNYS